MAKEIERRFLVHLDSLPDLGSGRRLVQGYLAERPHTRFRIEGNEVTLCVKEFLSEGERLEFEFPRSGMTAEEIEDLRRMALWPPLVKTRYDLPHGDLVWEVDVYEGRNAGLVTAEVELPSMEHAIAFPAWVDTDSEITTDHRYANIALTQRPYSEWSHEPSAEPESESGRSDRRGAFEA